MVNSNCSKVTDKLYECENQSNSMLYEDYNDPQSHTKPSPCHEPSGLIQDHNTFVQATDSNEHPGYQVLPKKFFKYDGVPPPLVRRSWLRLICGKTGESCDLGNECDTLGSETEEESSKEDSIPLSDLKLKLNNEELCDNRPDAHRNSMVVIQRKRGRPRKQLQPEYETTNSSNNQTNDFMDDLTLNNQDSNSEWWDKSIDLINDRELYINNVEVEDVEDSSIESNEKNTALDNSEELKEKDNHQTLTKKKKTKKKESNNEMTGIKMENSKVIFPCLECGKTFSAASTLKYHLRIHNGTLIKCTECDRGFTTNYLLKCHMRIHSGDLFMCHKCGRGFTTAELLKVHSRSHTGIRPYKCNVCGKSFPSASNLTQHKETHEPEKKYLCFQCGSSFSQKRCLDGHMLSHGEKNHICTVCGKLWARKSDLTEHMRVHTGYKPYACNSCHQKFTQASSLRRHQIVHMDANPIQCIICGKMLKCYEYYKRHMKKHLKEEGSK